jgi:hypothetical protein
MTKTAKPPKVSAQATVKKTRSRPNPPPAVTLEPLGSGRPQSYKPEFAELAYRMALLGLTDVELARFFDVSERTIAGWDKAHPEFAQSRMSGKLPADAEIAAKLYHRARGYEHADTHVSVINGQVILTPLIKHYPPDTQAAMWWLKNRQQGRWKDKFEIEASGTVQLGLIAMPPKTT